MDQLKELEKHIVEFIDERDWEQFHNIKDLAIAICLEASELLEHFQWKSTKELPKILEENREEIEDEVADVLHLIIEFARQANIDLYKASLNKLEKAKKKYPADLVRGKNHKYTYYQKKLK